MNTRELALDVLLEAEKNQSLSTNLVKDVLEKYDYEDPRDKAFFKRLTEGVMERQITLDYVLGCFSKTPVKKMKPLIRCLMRIGVYQILYMEGVPDSAACNEAVKLAKKRGFSTLSGFVNGVLRSVAKNRESIVWPDEIKEPAVFLSVRYSVPVWLVEKWIADYGYKRTLGMLEESVKVRPLTLHFKQSLGEQAVAEAVKAIADTKVRIMQHKVLPYAYVAEGADGVGSLPGYEEGLFWVQDKIGELLRSWNVVPWLADMLVMGVYRVPAWVVSVMLPPMAIFFPLFTLLEDLGYLPRVAFNLDKCFQACNACGKQALTMWVGC